MTTPTPVPLVPAEISVAGPDFAAIAAWPFADPFVARLLLDDVPLRATLNACRVWVYRDPSSQVVGFGTLDVCREYPRLTDGRPHPYIPLLAVNPTVKSLGYGTAILRHLMHEAKVLAEDPARCCGTLFLDVYVSSIKARSLYDKAGFESAIDEPLFDPQENGAGYVVMAKSVEVARS